MQADRRDARIESEVGHGACDVDVSLIAERQQHGDRQAALQHGQVTTDVAGLGDHGHAAFAGGEPMLIGPKRDA